MAGIHPIPLVETHRQNRQRIPRVTNVCVFHRCSHACIPSVLRASQNSGNTQEVLSQSRCRILEQNMLSGTQAAIRVFPTGICSPSCCVIDGDQAHRRNKTNRLQITRQSEPHNESNLDRRCQSL